MVNENTWWKNCKTEKLWDAYMIYTIHITIKLLIDYVTTTATTNIIPVFSCVAPADKSYQATVWRRNKQI